MKSNATVGTRLTLDLYHERWEYYDSKVCQSLVPLVSKHSCLLWEKQLQLPGDFKVRKMWTMWIEYAATECDVAQVHPSRQLQWAMTDHDLSIFQRKKENIIYVVLILYIDVTSASKTASLSSIRSLHRANNVDENLSIPACVKHAYLSILK